MSKHNIDDEFWDKVRKLLPNDLTDYSIEELQDIVEDVEISLIVDQDIAPATPIEKMFIEIAGDDKPFLDLLNEAWEKDCE